MRWLILSLLFLLCGCIHHSEPVWNDVPTAQQLLERVTANSERYSSLDTAASVALTSGSKFFSSQQFLLLQKPDHLRADILSGFGQLLLQMASDGETLSVFLNTTVPGRFFRGPASYENLYRFIRVPLAVEDLLSLLLYGPPLIAYRHSNVTVSAKHLILTLSDNYNNRQELLFDRQLRMVGSYYLTDGEKYLLVDYQNFSKTSQFPRRIKIDMPLEKTRVKLDLSELRINAKIDPARLSLKAHNNIPVEVLTE